MSSLKLEIQGLRAVAVLLVLIFHVWPSALTGGYVGVDVFFVISGYLITGLLLREARRSGTISLLDFYARRVRRLLPASTLVIVAVASAVTMLPKVQWADTAKEVLASTFYVQNWWLAGQAVDYLAQDNALSLLRHYWSLSVEEQYYIIWPLFFLVVTGIFKAARRRPSLVFGVIIALIAATSLAYSVYLTEANPGLAYFATTTRAWELAIGGLLAVLLPRYQAARMALAPVYGWIGLLAIGFASVRFDEGTSFPGYAALLPTVGAVLVIAAGRSESWWSSYGLLASRPMQHIGDISYSLYLWHWPIVVLYRLQSDGDLGIPGGLMVLAISWLLAHLTKVFVEDPFRDKSWRRLASLNQPVVTGALSFALALLAANYIWVLNSQITSEQSAVFASAGDIRKLLRQEYDPAQPTVPSVLEARRDNPDVYGLKCHVDQVSSEPLTCEFGPANAAHHVVLVGDSHAAQWLPSLQGLLDNRKSWRITTFTKSSCTFNAAPVVIGKNKLEYSSCNEWNRRVMAEIAKIKPDVIVTSQASSQWAVGARNKADSQRLLADGLLKRWAELKALGARVLVVRDTPWMSRNPVECMSTAGASPQKCATKTAKAFKRDSIMLAMKSKPEVSLLDITKNVCSKDWCLPVKGQVLLWRDRHHLTATFARSLSGEFKGLLKMVN
ncbi:Peptidoglycan/LPS O-acetylase OafA/YrhL, contains acyltransferase and SGNH-hydrolase domains [Pseudomonas pohangensis]|uniref:Peptidoglycan/LPS O-acetylase OafA/YrhL, contains acyltransferase and SGNH-hydrolase domains n=1 Tax=Pseudomonas pohangensis TaxID=364197 RepID=A0A1H2H1V1_9PSED|nr:acyltransferase family protein [Pseudomonas pohangensis]SDU25578.1 Peptidoglycan/LPS O-acetylase OafA/YrhL, contains acyltransferase and SGNH-hydrolase domains [Pseudomonas pohangensis]